MVMDSHPHTATAQASRDLSPEWLELIARIRGLARRALEDPKDDATTLATESLRLCLHVERLHAAVEDLLGGLSQEELQTTQPPAPAKAAPASDKPSEDERVAMDIQREIHQDKVNVRDVIKALFLWQDSPADRLDDRE